jgi:teichuronic acid biosynthesis glycosyltransferase TuaH
VTNHPQRLVSGNWDDLIVMWGNGPWDGHRLGAQAIAEALSERAPVLYIDPPRSLAAVARAGVTGIRAAAQRPRLSLVSPRLARLSPFGPPAQTRPGVRPATSAWLAHSVRRSISALGGSVRAVISGYLYCRPFGYGERVRVFRASDDFSVGAELGVPVRYMARAQRRLAASADAVVCVSPTLVDTWRARGYDPVLVPNGCDAERLRRAHCLPVPGDVALRPPIIGLTGLLGNRIDFDLLRAIAERGHSLLIVGGVRPDLDPASISDLLDRQNVQWVGHRSYAELPAYLGAMTVGIVPYADIAFNRASFPLKLLEYLAVGLPVVATDLPSVRWVDTDLIRVANRNLEFADAVEEALAGADDDGERRRRLEFAAQHSWAHRAEDYLAIIDDVDSRVRRAN